MNRFLLPLIGILFLAIQSGFADDSLKPDWFEPGQIWEFHNGEEFPPGAEGSWSLAKVDGRNALQLDYDFRQGGKYILVSSKRPPDVADAREVQFAFKASTPCRILLRVVDCNREYFQFIANYTEVNEWKDCRFILDEERGRVAFAFGGNISDLVVDRPILVWGFGVERPKDEATTGQAWFSDLEITN